MSEWTGVVVAKSENGIKVKDKGPWLNWSLPDYRGTPFDSDVKAGDKVRIEYAAVEKDGNKRTYISVIENLSRASSFSSRPEDADNPFPPEEGFTSDGDFKGDNEMPTDAAESPPAGTIDKDRLIVRQVCVKAASEALAISPLDTEERAGRITYLAGELESWIFRD